jgi:hypothetical protein
MRNSPTHDRTLKLDILVRLRIALHRLDESNDLRILTRTTRLLLVHVTEIGPLRDRLAEIDARLSDHAFDVVFSTHAFHVDLEMQFAHSRYDRLTDALSKR